MGSSAALQVGSISVPVGRASGGSSGPAPETSAAGSPAGGKELGFRSPSWCEVVLGQLGQVGWSECSGPPLGGPADGDSRASPSASASGGHALDMGPDVLVGLSGGPLVGEELLGAQSVGGDRSVSPTPLFKWWWLPRGTLDRELGFPASTQDMRRHRARAKILFAPPSLGPPAPPLLVAMDRDWSDRARRGKRSYDDMGRGGDRYRGDEIGRAHV